MPLYKCFMAAEGALRLRKDPCPTPLSTHQPPQITGRPGPTAKHKRTARGEGVKQHAGWEGEPDITLHNSPCLFLTIA